MNSINVGKYSFSYDEKKIHLITDNKWTLLFLDDDYSNILLKIIVSSNNEVSFIPTEHLDLQNIKIVAQSDLKYKIISL